MSQYQSKFPTSLDTFENHGSKDGIGLDIDWQKSDELSSEELDLITDAILEIERKLENMGATTISAAQWGYLGELDQSLITTAGPTFDHLHLTSGQIGFPAVQVPSANVNTLDDYEEGTWTPGISFGGAVVGITYATQLGMYVKIGKMVMISAEITLTSKGVSVGAALITGLPIIVNATNYSSVSIYIGNTISFADRPQGITMIGTTTIRLAEVSNAGVATLLDNTNFANNSSITLTAIYS